MASSYASLFGTNGSGRQNRIGNLFGQQPSQDGPQVPQGQQAQRATPTYQQTFAQMQQQGQARPAPPTPQANAYQQFQGSQQAQAARAPMLQAVQQQLAQPTRFDTQAFQQMRQAQAANLQSEFADQQRALNEDLARRGLSASTIGAAGLGRLQGAQSRALADLDAQLLSQAAQTQAQDRLAALQASGQFAELAGAQDLREFEANRVGQAQRFQEALAAAQFGQGQSEFDRAQALQAAQLEQTGGLGGLDLQLRAALGMGGLDLDAARLQQEAQLQGRSLSLQEARAAAEQDLANRQLAQTGQLQGRELELRAQQLAQEAALQGRSLTLDEARLAAQQEQFGQQFGLDRERLTQQGQQFALEQALRERLGLGGLDVDRQRLAQQESQFGRELTQQQRQFQLQLAAALSGLSDAQRRQLLANPMFAGATGTQPSAPASGVPGAPIGPNPQTGGFLTPEQQSDIQRQLEEWFRNNPVGG